MANPQPTQSQLRAKLEKMVLGDLLGPVGGESEELAESEVHSVGKTNQGWWFPGSGRLDDDSSRDEAGE